MFSLAVVLHVGFKQLVKNRALWLCIRHHIYTRAAVGHCRMADDAVDARVMVLTA